MHVRDAVADFDKGIKHDPALFMTLKMDKQWISWHHSIIAQARTQDVDDVLNWTFNPSTQQGKLQTIHLTLWMRWSSN